VIRGILFDLDGTLFDAPYDWPAIKRRLGVRRADGSILDHLGALPPDERRRKRAELEAIERRATRDGRLREGVPSLLDSLRARGLRLALVTNNHGRCVNEILTRYALRFDVVVTRDDGLFKPSAAPLLAAARRLGLKPPDLAAVGDNEFDNRAAHEAGMAYVIIVNADVERFTGRCDFAVPDLAEARRVLDRL
jgi:phosphoglycolate phosphatase